MGKRKFTVTAASLSTAKKPKSNEKHVGIEIEFCTEFSREEVTNYIRKSGWGQWLQLKSDSSVQATPRTDQFGYQFNYGGGLELCVLAPRSKLKRMLPDLLKILKEDLKAYVNNSCGLHVHLDMRNRNPLRAYQNLCKMQGLMFKMVPSHRRSNSYCYRNTYANIWSAIREDNRYLAVNPQSLPDLNTIEIRLHHGTLEASSILNWVDVLNRVADAKEITKAPATVTGAARVLKLERPLVQYMREAIQTARAA